MSILCDTFSSRSGEIDIREEVHGILYGTTSEPPRGHYVMILRAIMNRPCCVNKTSGKYDEPSASRHCHACEGLGWYPEKIIVKARRSFLKDVGGTTALVISGINSVRYYVEWNIFTDEAQAGNSRVAEINLDSNGNIVEPIKRVLSYKIESATPFREDNGRIQYWALDVAKLEI